MRIFHAALVAITLMACADAEPEEATTSTDLTLVTNYALGKPTSQSTTAFGGSSARAVDGSTDGVWGDSSVTHTDYNTHAWWQVDLLQGRYIDSIAIWGRTDCCTGRLSNYYVMVSQKPFASNDLATTLADPNVQSRFVSGTSALPVQRISFGTIARYVRVQLSGTDYLSLAEVQVLDRANTIPGPDAIAAHTTWVAAGITTSSTGFALAEVGDSLRSYQRGAAGTLQETIDLGAPHDIPGSVAISTDPVAAFTDAASGHTYVAARAAGGQGLVADYTASTGTWSWTVLPPGDGPPSVAAACGKMYFAQHESGQFLDVYARPVSSSGFGIAASIAGVRSPPTLAAAPGGDLGVAWTGTDNWIRFARASCASGGVVGGMETPWGTSYSASPVGIVAYGNLFGVAVVGTDNKPYFAMQRPDANGNPSWAGFEAVMPSQTIYEAPVAVMYRGLIFLAGRDSSNQMRYWIREPNSFAPIANYNMWFGGGIVSGYGTGATRPAFATRGQRAIKDAWSFRENVEAELYVATKGIGDQQLYALNFGRFVTWDILAVNYGIAFNTKYEGNDVDPRTMANFPDFLPGFLEIPAKYRWWASHPSYCPYQMTILLETNETDVSTGWTNEQCGPVNLDDGRMYYAPASLLDANRYPPWTIWEELGHQLTNAPPGFKDQTGYYTLFGNLSAPTCRTSADCGGATCAYADGETTTMYCQNTELVKWLRPLGYVDWYDTTMDEHSFLYFVEFYRWWGDDLRAMRDSDLSFGNTLLRDKYNWVKANYYDGVEFNGSHAALGTDTRNLGRYGRPLH